MKKNLLFLFCAALCSSFFTSCDLEKLANNDNNKEDKSDINWWFRANLAPYDSVQSIKTEYGETRYDKQGRLTTFIRPFGDDMESVTTYEYNSDNLPIKKIEEGPYSNSTIEYEYNNKGKFCPASGMDIHFYSCGLIPNLSKMKITYNDGSVRTSTFTFDTDGNLTIISKEGEFGDTVFVTYKDNYPYKYEGEFDFVGPVTYQANGMIDSYTEGYKGGDGEIYSTRNYFYRKDFKNAMLVDRWEDKEDKLNAYTTFEYDENGNVIKETYTEERNGSKRDNVTTYSYKFDSKGNWIECATTYPGSNQPSIETRTILYY